MIGRSAPRPGLRRNGATPRPVSPRQHSGSRREQDSPTTAARRFFAARHRGSMLPGCRSGGAARAPADQRPTVSAHPVAPGAGPRPPRLRAAGGSPELKAADQRGPSNRPPGGTAILRRSRPSRGPPAPATPTRGTRDRVGAVGETTSASRKSSPRGKTRRDGAVGVRLSAIATTSRGRRRSVGRSSSMWSWRLRGWRIELGSVARLDQPRSGGQSGSERPRRL